jgi:hypothetical protein
MPLSSAYLTKATFTATSGTTTHGAQDLNRLYQRHIMRGIM